MLGISTAPIADLSLNRLLEPEVLADPYPLYRRLREEDPVHWDPYLHAWVVTRFTDVSDVLAAFSADRTPSPRKLASLGMDSLIPIAEVLERQMLFVDPPKHTRLRSAFGTAFTARRMERLRERIGAIANAMLDDLEDRVEIDLIEDFAVPFPAVVIAELLGVPTEDRVLLKEWSETFAEILGNFQHNPGRVRRLLASLDEMLTYFRDAGRCPARPGRDGLVHALAASEAGDDGLTEDEIAANFVSLMTGGQETTTNLIGNGFLTLFRHPDQLRRLLDDPALIPSAVEELLRFESPSQFSARTVWRDGEFGGKRVEKGQAVIAVMGAANRDPAVFDDPDRFDVGRQDNRHLGFGWGPHFCPGAGLTRIEGEVAFSLLLRRYPHIRQQPGPLTWRPNLGLRGLSRLDVVLRG